MKKKLFILGMVFITLAAACLVFILLHKKTTETPVTKTITSADIQKQVSGFSISAVQSNNRPESCYVAIDNEVFNVTKFVAGLNGEKKTKLLRYCGQDITGILNNGEDQIYRKVDLELGNAVAAKKTLANYKIGIMTNGI